MSHEMSVAHTKEFFFFLATYESAADDALEFLVTHMDESCHTYE